MKQICKHCMNTAIRVVRDMHLWWVECDKCKTTYMIE